MAREINVNEKIVNVDFNGATTELIDSEGPIKFLAIGVLCRNNEAYLPSMFKMLANMEKAYDCRFEYYFVENGSKDNTVGLIKDFLKSRDGKLICPGNSEKLDKMSRTDRLAYARNIIKSSVPNESRWTLVLDTDIYFEPSILDNFFSSVYIDEEIAMVCSYGVEFFRVKSINKWYTQDHYYDTFAYVDERKKLYWPYCIFSDCERCKDQYVTEKKDPTGLVEVQSAFGGFAMIKTSVLKHEQISWYAPNSGRSMLCEHIGFCELVSKHSGKKIVIDCNSIVYWEPETSTTSVGENE